jgi:CSLREA domain-containing protein
LKRAWTHSSLTLIVLWLGIASAWAASFVVTKLDDTDDGICSSDCSVREALAAASSGDTVSFGIDVRGTSTLVLGDLVIDRPLTIVGPGQNALTLSGGDTQRIFTITANGALTASQLTFAHGKGQYYAPLGVEAAGVVLNSGSFAFTDCTFAENHADGRPNAQFVNDAAVAYSNAFNKPISFTRCLFRDNSAGGGACLDIDGGTLTITDSTFLDNFGEFGPATVIANSSGPLTITGTTFSGNSAVAGGALFVSGTGGAVLKNATLTGNSSDSGFGGGIYVYGPGSVTLNNVTLSGNVAGVGSNLYLTNGGTAVVRNTIVADTSSNCGGTGTITSHGYNLDSGNTCGLHAAGDRTSTPAGLAPLAASGGTTPTMALYWTSAALNSGNPAAPGSGGDACEAKDERSVSRPQFSGCDIGAFESTGPETIGTSGFNDPLDKSVYAWPAQPGVTQYETRRSGTTGFAAPCLGITTTGTSWRDTEIPAPGSAFFYINRPFAPQLGTWGWNSAGVERTTACP